MFNIHLLAAVMLRLTHTSLVRSIIGRHLINYNELGLIYSTMTFDRIFLFLQTESPPNPSVFKPISTYRESTTK